MFRWTAAGLFCVILLSGCGQARRGSEIKSAPPASSAAPSTSAAGPVEQVVAASGAQPRDALHEVQALNSSRFPMPSANFEPGTVSPLGFDAQVRRTKEGFSIQMPSGSPIPTPTIYRGRLYVGGGFSSKEFYCFNAVTGDYEWGARLSDDGPSTAVACGDSILFNSESCTIFALDATKGTLRWAHYMGDPMMSAPCIADGRVFTVYPAAPQEVEHILVPAAKQEIAKGLQPTYIVACLDAQSGKVAWRRWIDGDCIAAPVAEGNELHLAAMPGTLYRFRAGDGAILGAWHARATSAPVMADDIVFFTRRTDVPGSAPTEAIVGFSRASSLVTLVALNRPAPYLDRVIQESSAATISANRAESLNGIGGGFGGGFNSVPDHISLADASGATLPEPRDEAATQDAPAAAESPAVPLDPLAAQQQKAADNLGLGNVSTLQAFQGSRILHIAGRNYNCMGSELLCSSAKTGERLWSLKLPGDLKKLGGHLAAPPVWSDGHLFVAAVVGDVLQIGAISGAVKARHEVGSELRYPPVVAEGRLYVGTQDGKVVCIKIGPE